MPAGVIVTGNHPADLWPGMHDFFGREYDKHPEEWQECFDVMPSEQAYEEEAELTGFGLAPVKGQTTSTSFDSETQGPTTRYTHVAYSLGYIVSREALADGLYEKVSKRRIQALGFSMQQTKENVGANIFNRAFNSSFTGGNGTEMCATDQGTLDGTQSNELSTAADLAESSLEELLIQIMLATNTRGLKISLMGMCLLVPPNLYFDAARIVESTLRSGTAENDINVIKAHGLLPDGVKVNHYFTDADAWFIKTNAPSGLQWFEREAVDFTQDNDFDTDNAKAKAYERYSAGWTDWRGVYGTPGA